MTKVGEGGGQQNIVLKIEALYFVWLITQSGPTKGLCDFLSDPWPSESNKDNRGQHDQHFVKKIG